MRGRTALESPEMDRSRMNRMDVWMMIPVFWLLHLTKLNNHEIFIHIIYLFQDVGMKLWPPRWVWNCNRCKWLRRLERCWTKSTDEPKRGQAPLPSAVEKKIGCHRHMWIAMRCKGQCSTAICTTSSLSPFECKVLHRLALEACWFYLVLVLADFTNTQRISSPQWLETWGNVSE